MRFLLIIFGLLSAATFAAERDYQLPFCERLSGKVEYVLPDRTRVDCLTSTHAIEVDYAKKWPEAIGQALHYARLTDTVPGIALIVETEKDQVYLNRLYSVIRHWHLPIQVWVLDNGKGNER